MLFNGWTVIGRTLLVGICAYAALLVLLRLSGKRTLSKMNAFDLVVTVALGSTLATILLAKEVALAEGVTAFVTLIALQGLITWLAVRSERVQRWVKADPRLLLHQGKFLEKALVEERVTREEILAALRAQGVASTDQVHAVVLETDGSFSVLGSGPDSERSTLATVRGAGQCPRAGAGNPSRRVRAA